MSSSSDPEGLDEQTAASIAEQRLLSLHAARLACDSPDMELVCLLLCCCAACRSSTTPSLTACLCRLQQQAARRGCCSRHTTAATSGEDRPASLDTLMLCWKRKCDMCEPC